MPSQFFKRFKRTQRHGRAKLCTKLITMAIEELERVVTHTTKLGDDAATKKTRNIIVKLVALAVSIERNANIKDQK